MYNAHIVTPPIKLELWIKKEVLAPQIEFQMMRALTRTQVHTLLIELEHFEHMAVKDTLWLLKTYYCC